MLILYGNVWYKYFQIKRKMREIKANRAWAAGSDRSPTCKEAPGFLHIPPLAGLRGSAVSSCRVDTMVDLLEMAHLKQSSSMEQRLASLEEQVGSGLGPLFLGTAQKDLEGRSVLWWL